MSVTVFRRRWDHSGRSYHCGEKAVFSVPLTTAGQQRTREGKCLASHAAKAGVKSPSPKTPCPVVKEAGQWGQSSTLPRRSQALTDGFPPTFAFQFRPWKGERRKHNLESNSAPSFHFQGTGQRDCFQVASSRCRPGWGKGLGFRLGSRADTAQTD